jgi:N-acetylmuramoyl-L-alanine amidase
VSVSALCRRFDLEAELREEDGGCVLTLPTVTLRCTEGLDYALADGRYLYTPGGYLLLEGELFLPAEAAAHLFGIGAAVTEEPPRVDLDTGRFHLLTGGTDYYTLHFSVDDLYWLSHIIYSESHLQPLAGQIGVGNVVLNRVASPLYPDTIMEVVLQRSENAVQFDPTADGSVHAPVDEPAMIAACLCLEGFNTVGDSMFFVNPDRGDNTWFEAERQFTVRIGEHDFYS